MHWYKQLAKPAVDYSAAVIGLLLLWPLLLVLYVVGKVIFGEGLFIQTRIGRSEKAFSCFKLRTLYVAGNDHSAPAWGKFMRASSLDELPQLINILRGEMSLVGPRPLLPEYLPYYTAEQQKRHAVKPGITGLAQVKGRNKLSWQESLYWDSYYAEHVSLYLDTKIIALTFTQLFKFDQTKHKGMPNRPPFNEQHRE